MERLEEALKSKMEHKQRLEVEMQSLEAFLNGPNMPGVRGPLVDGEGFPRNDVDLYAVRNARHKIARLQTDYRNLVDQIESDLHELHAATRIAGPTGGDVTSTQPSGSSVDDATMNSGYASMYRHDNTPILGVVASVASGSPAESSGMRVGDMIRAMGPVEAAAGGSLTELPAVVSNSEGIELCIVIRRSGDDVQLSLAPRRWAGNGLLGCHIVPPQK